MSKKRKCPECRDEIKSGETDLHYVMNKVNVSVTNVPADVCSGCGLSFLNGGIAEDVNRMVNKGTEDSKGRKPYISELVEEKSRTQRKMAARANGNIKEMLDNAEKTVEKMIAEHGVTLKYADLKPCRDDSIGFPVSSTYPS